ncbi:hypothetical protein PPERSA_02119 [Pseudocohnilembus persalinus]|uniref:Uncharacterized protein n=1 Tax=Pseudocohnilembus persalinus TaxID=266149 RepID=A0A0V0Q808_PSEPJ|nr:hypothetical protein PPERSA_02119 [Pseudocohnilembus persalinus]|eukprot:KRW98342.1 hypothetical protein PPERSA_02119 [Pseudocohnilembus persalinus]
MEKQIRNKKEEQQKMAVEQKKLKKNLDSSFEDDDDEDDGIENLCQQADKQEDYQTQKDLDNMDQQALNQMENEYIKSGGINGGVLNKTQLAAKKSGNTKNK